MVEPADRSLDAAIRAAIDAKTKPPGALGRIEALAFQIARVQGTRAPRAESATLLVFAADHGIAAERVSAYPQVVTGQMAATIAGGGAASSVLARTLGLALVAVDAGIAGAPLALPGLLDRRIAPGTANSCERPAMTQAQLAVALAAGRALGRAAAGEAVACGEMGIGNTSSAALVLHKCLDLPLATLTGRGAGLDDAGLAHKAAVLARAAARNPGPLAPLAALAEYGGFEIAMMAGAMAGAAQTGRLALVDGFIATAAAAVLLRLSPGFRDHAVFAHRSAERGHAAALDALGAQPLLDLEMRLGEGTGAVLAWPLVRAAAAMLREMASFESAGVSGRT